MRHKSNRGKKFTKVHNSVTGEVYHIPSTRSKLQKALAGNGIVRVWFSTHASFEINKGGAQTMLKRLKVEIGIQCNAHSFRRGFCIHQKGLLISEWSEPLELDTLG